MGHPPAYIDTHSQRHTNILPGFAFSHAEEEGSPALSHSPSVFILLLLLLFFFKFTFMYQHPEEQMMGDDRLEEERERVARREEEWVGQGIRERRKSRGSGLDVQGSQVTGCYE